MYIMQMQMNVPQEISRSTRQLDQLPDAKELTSSNGLVSLKQDSQTSLTTFVAISSDSQDGLPTIESIALRFTQF